MRIVFNKRGRGWDGGDPSRTYLVVIPSHKAYWTNFLNNKIFRIFYKNKLFFRMNLKCFHFF